MAAHAWIWAELWYEVRSFELVIGDRPINSFGYKYAPLQSMLAEPESDAIAVFKGRPEKGFFSCVIPCDGWPGEFLAELLGFLEEEGVSF